MKLIENYLESLQKIYDHVGFKEDWVICPLDDQTDKYWDVDEKSVYYADSYEDFDSENEGYYVDDIYKQRFYKKWVYTGEDFTMIFCNPGVDGMTYFRLFDNSKRMNR